MRLRGEEGELQIADAARFRAAAHLRPPLIVDVFLLQLCENLLRTLIYLTRHACKSCNVNAITLVSRAIDDFVEEHDLIVPLADGDVQIAHAAERFRQI